MNIPQQKKGFTLIELLVVVAIIGILASVVLSLLSESRKKGVDAAVKQNVTNARLEAEVFYNTTGGNSYTDVCGVNGVGGVGPLIFAASKAVGLSGAYSVNVEGAPGRATCNYNANAWIAEVPTSATGSFWCADSTGISKQESATSISAANDYTCI